MVDLIDDVWQEINKEVQYHNGQKNKRVKFISVTFKDIVEKFRGILIDYEFELIDMIDDYEGYCVQDQLIVDDEDRMRVVTCGWTIEENFEYSLYYDPAERGYSDHAFLGIYTNKSVRGIGEIENIITADIISNDELKIITSSSSVTSKQEANIIGVIAAAKRNNNWNIERGHKFFCVKEFFKTDFKKLTKYPLQGTKLFNLKDELKLNKLPEAESIAELLKTKTW